VQYMQLTNFARLGRDPPLLHRLVRTYVHRL
jgi:hypothetical protein